MMHGVKDMEANINNMALSIEQCAIGKNMWGLLGAPKSKMLHIILNL